VEWAGSGERKGRWAARWVEREVELSWAGKEREEEKVEMGFETFFKKLLKFYLNLKTPTKNHAMV
jgi:hypothetical protein